MNEDYDFDKPQSRLYPWFNVLYYIALYLTVMAFIMVFGNGLDNFLHAPIGIKENPPPPSDLVALADALVVPIGISTFVLRFFRWLCREFPTSVVLTWFGGIIFFGIAGVAFIGKFWLHQEIVPGSFFLFDRVWPIIYRLCTVVFGLCMVAFVCLIAYGSVDGWKKRRTVRNGLVALGMSLSTLAGLIALVTWHFLPQVSERLLGPAVLVFIVCVFSHEHEQAEKNVQKSEVKPQETQSPE